MLEEKPVTSNQKPVRIFLVSALLFLASPSYAADISVTARVDKHQVTLDDTLTLTVIVEGETRSLPAPEIPPISGFRTYSSSRSQNISIVNGEIFASVTFRYILVPQSIGKVTIPSIQVVHHGRSYETNPISVEIVQATTSPSFPAVTPQPAPSSTQTTEPPPGGTKKLFIQTYVDKLRPYVNEQVTLTFAFYRAVDLFENPEYEAPATVGFWSEDMPPQKQYLKTIDGRTYQVTEIKTALFPTTAGELTIGPARLKVTLREEPQDWLSQNPFDVFRQDPFAVFSRGKTITLSTQPITLSAEPLPEQEKPENFKGDVGEYSLSVKADKTELEVNQPMTLILEVSGKGNIKTITIPSVKLPQGFKEYEGGGSEDITKEDYLVQGKKIFEKILVPTLPGDYTVSPVEYIYFNAKKQKYETAHSEPIVIKAKPSPKQQESLVGVTAGVPPKTEIRQLGEDIRFIKTEVPVLEDQQALPWEHPFFWWVHSLPWLVLGLLFSWQRHREKLSQDIYYARQQKAQGLARKRLRLARSRLNAKDGMGFYTEVQKALLSFLSDRLRIATTSLTFDEIIKELLDRGIEEKVLLQFRALLEECDRARFAPFQLEPSQMEKRLSEAESLIIQLQRAKKGKVRARVVAIGFLTCLLFCGSSVWAQTNLEIFEEANSFYQNQKYEEAIQGYRRLLQGGIRHGIVYYNLANAYWKNGERANAILNLERARRLQPRDPDILANLTLLQGQMVVSSKESKLLMQDQQSVSLLEGFAQTLTGPFSIRELLKTSVILYWIFIFVVLLWILGGRFRSRLVSWAGSALFFWVLTSGLTLLKFYDLNQPDAIVLEKEIGLRSGPGKDFSTQAALPEGTKVRIKRQNQAWMEVKIGSLQGWIPQGTVERI